MAVAAHHALEFVGLPEAKLNLSQAVIYLALAPKSNASAVAVWSADEDIRSSGPLPVPDHLRDSHGSASKATGAGKGYEYPHAHGGWVPQDHLPDEMRGRRYFHPVAGREAELDRDLQDKKQAGGVGSDQRRRAR